MSISLLGTCILRLECNYLPNSSHCKKLRKSLLIWSIFRLTSAFLADRHKHTRTPKHSHTLYAFFWVIPRCLKAYKIQTPGNYSEETQHSEHSESLKSRTPTHTHTHTHTHPHTHTHIHTYTHTPTHTPHTHTHTHTEWAYFRV
jgi:hypothetical protein